MVKAVRDRHDGTRRNPFDEFECGHHYARAMASWAVLNALTGFAADLPPGGSPSPPRRRGRDGSPPSSASGRGGGSYRQRFAGRGGHATRSRCAAGSVELGTLAYRSRRAGSPPAPSVRARVGGRTVAATTSATVPGHRGAPGPGRHGLGPGRPLVVEVGPGRKRPMARDH